MLGLAACADPAPRAPQVVLATDCPDPGVTRDRARYVLTCTSSDDRGPAFPLYTSADLQTWEPAGAIFPARPAWARGDFWAPEVHAIGGGVVAYYSARDAGDRLVLGAATAPAALGPYTDLGAPLLDGGDTGLIDASAFVDTDGTPYLLWKDDGNATGDPTPIHAAPLTADGRALRDDTSEPATLVTNDRAWEGAVTEAPFLVERDGTYYLFYSGGSYADATYAVGVARAPAILGPYEKAPAPILVSSDDWVGPGHCSVVTAPDGTDALVYHAWRADCVADPGCERQVLVAALRWGADGWPTVD